MKLLIVYLCCLMFVFSAEGQQKMVLTELANQGLLSVYNRKIAVENDVNGPFIRVSQDKGEGIVWLPIHDFKFGKITLEMRGKNVPQQSFLGIAFHGQNDSTYESVYCRPFNFNSPDSVKRIHSIQYIAHPKFTWMLLREHFNAQYENEILSPPNPDDWFRMCIEITESYVTIFVNDSKQPSLKVKRLHFDHNGKVGLFVANNSGGDFRIVEISNTFIQ